MRPLPILCLSAFSVAAQASDDAQWHRAVEALVSQGYELTANDKAAGLLQGKRRAEKNSPYFVCSSGRGAFDHIEYLVTITLDEDPKVQVTAVGHWYQNRHIVVFRTSQIWNQAPCESRGELERDLLSRIATPSAD